MANKMPLIGLISIFIHPNPNAGSYGNGQAKGIGVMLIDTAQNGIR
jgi:hypothetical protein